MSETIVVYNPASRAGHRVAMDSSVSRRLRSSPRTSLNRGESRLTDSTHVETRRWGAWWWSEELARKEYRDVEDTMAYRQTQARIETDRRCRFLADNNL